MDGQSQESNEIQFKFTDDEIVKLRVGIPALDLSDGALGQVCCLYLTEPPGYEVEFICADGKNLSMIVFEPEIEKASDEDVRC